MQETEGPEGDRLQEFFEAHSTTEHPKSAHEMQAELLKDMTTRFDELEQQGHKLIRRVPLTPKANKTRKQKKQNIFNSRRR